MDRFGKVLACWMAALLLAYALVGCGLEAAEAPVLLWPEETPPALQMHTATPAPPQQAQGSPPRNPAPTSSARPSPIPEKPPETAAPEATQPQRDAGAKQGYPTNLEEAQAANPDVIGWMKIPNTRIDGPILYDKAFYYANHDVLKNQTEVGSIYSYYNQLTRNVIIAGMNMRREKLLFYDLHVLQDQKELLAEQKNRICEINFCGIEKWEIFALYETADPEPASTLRRNTSPMLAESPAEAEAWATEQKERSELRGIVDVPVTGNDIFMTLVTAGDHYDYPDAQSRLYVFLKAIQPEGGAQ